jgi:hypothetical protein
MVFSRGCPTTRWTRAAGACFGTRIIRQGALIRRVNLDVMLLPPVNEPATARAIILAVSILAIGAVTMPACSLLYIDRDLSGPVTLNQNWLELT